MTDSSNVVDIERGVADPDLKSLLAAIADQDQGAFATFYDATLSRVYGLALRILRMHEFAEEVVCDVYLQVWHEANRYDPARADALAWLMILCRSRALDALRQAKAAGGGETLADEERADEESAEDMLLAVEQDSVVQRALRTLNANQRQLLALAYFRGFSHDELARFTGIPLGTVKTLLRRALRALKAQMSAAGTA